MPRPDKIDLFDLSNCVLDKLNCDGRFKLTHYDFELKFRRDVNHPSDKFNIYLVLFGQELAVTYYTPDCNTVDKIVNLLFVHLRDDCGYEKTEDAITSTKRRSLEEKLGATIHELNLILALNHTEKLIVLVDEQFPYGSFDEKGLPIYELNVYSKEAKIDIKIELDHNSCDFNDKAKIMETIKSSINSV